MAENKKDAGLVNETEASKAVNEKKARGEKVDFKKLKADFELAQAYGALYLRNDNKGFKRTKELEELKKKAEKIEGLKAKKDKTLFMGGVRLTMVKDMPVPKLFTDLATDAQKKQYFA
jgi:hypothetical protein